MEKRSIRKRGSASTTIESPERFSNQNKKPRGVVPSPSTGLLDLSNLSTGTSDASVCGSCHSPVKMDYKHIGVATIPRICCSTEGCLSKLFDNLPKTKFYDGSNSHSQRVHCAVNILCVLGFLSCGDGRSEAERLLGFLGLPNCTSMGKTTFGSIEKVISPFIQAVTEKALCNQLIEEVRCTVVRTDDPEYTMQDFYQWRAWILAEDQPKPTKTPSISVSADMGWQKRSSGRKYDSHSGHMSLNCWCRNSTSSCMYCQK